jgi:3'-phosphoadenosine 5'-phosphosulfate sulfotransferase (PAPS reductase)/FAD synthetase
MIEKSREIVQRAITDYKPYAKVGLFSGGNDSLLLLELLKELNIELDFVIHVHTGTGLPQTLDFVRKYCSEYGSKYIEASANGAYERYVLRKGFFGAGNDAHTYAYHQLKTNPLEKSISKFIRQRKVGRKILLINGIRVEESKNRKANYGNEEINIYKRKANDIWVNVIHWWTTEKRNEYLEGNNIKRNPVSIELGRSGECMCGTMQGTLSRVAAKKYCPSWGKWLDDLEKAVVDKGFPWKWGENINKSHLMERNGQLNMFQPMCVGCKALQ